MSIIRDYLSHPTKNLFQWDESEEKILKYLSTIITMSQWLVDGLCWKQQLLRTFRHT